MNASRHWDDEVDRGFERRADRHNRAERRAQAYAAQGAVYVDAVRRFLEDPPVVRFELWFLAADRIIEVPA